MSITDFSLGAADLRAYRSDDEALLLALNHFGLLHPPAWMDKAGRLVVARNDCMSVAEALEGDEDVESLLAHCASFCVRAVSSGLLFLPLRPEDLVCTASGVRLARPVVATKVHDEVLRANASGAETKRAWVAMLPVLGGGYESLFVYASGALDEQEAEARRSAESFAASGSIKFDARRLIEVLTEREHDELKERLGAFERRERGRAQGLWRSYVTAAHGVSTTYDALRARRWYMRPYVLVAHKAREDISKSDNRLVGLSRALVVRAGAEAWRLLTGRAQDGVQPRTPEALGDEIARGFADRLPDGEIDVAERYIVQLLRDADGARRELLKGDLELLAAERMKPKSKLRLQGDLALRSTAELAYTLGECAVSRAATPKQGRRVERLFLKLEAADAQYRAPVYRWKYRSASLYCLAVFCALHASYRGTLRLAELEAWDKIWARVKEYVPRAIANLDARSAGEVPTEDEWLEAERIALDLTPPKLVAVAQWDGSDEASRALLAAWRMACYLDEQMLLDDTDGAFVDAVALVRNERDKERRRCADEARRRRADEARVEFFFRRVGRFDYVGSIYELREKRRVAPKEAVDVSRTAVVALATCMLADLLGSVAARPTSAAPQGASRDEVTARAADLFVELFWVQTPEDARRAGRDAAVRIREALDALDAFGGDEAESQRDNLRKMLRLFERAEGTTPSSFDRAEGTTPSGVDRVIAEMLKEISGNAEAETNVEDGDDAYEDGDEDGEDNEAGAGARGRRENEGESAVVFSRDQQRISGVIDDIENKLKDKPGVYGSSGPAQKMHPSRLDDREFYGYMILKADKLARAAPEVLGALKARLHRAASLRESLADLICTMGANARRTVDRVVALGAVRTMELASGHSVAEDQFLDSCAKLVSRRDAPEGLRMARESPERHKGLLAMAGVSLLEGLGQRGQRTRYLLERAREINARVDGKALDLARSIDEKLHEAVDSIKDARVDANRRVFTRAEIYMMKNFGMDPLKDDAFVRGATGSGYFYDAHSDPGEGLLSLNYSTGWESSLGWSPDMSRADPETAETDAHLRKLGCEARLSILDRPDLQARVGAAASATSERVVAFLAAGTDYLRSTHLREDHARLLLERQEGRLVDLAKLQALADAAGRRVTVRTWKDALAAVGVRLTRSSTVFCYHEGCAPRFAARQPVYGIPEALLSVPRRLLKSRAEAALSRDAVRYVPPNPSRLCRRLRPLGPETDVEVRQSACVPLWRSLGRLPRDAVEEFLGERSPYRDFAGNFRDTGSIVYKKPARTGGTLVTNGWPWYEPFDEPAGLGGAEPEQGNDYTTGAVAKDSHDSTAVDRPEDLYEREGQEYIPDTFGSHEIATRANE